ncbi:MAG: heme lyase CcmF/NrfE family subunit [Legionella sp.]
MIAELGLYSLIIALMFSILLGVIPAIGIRLNRLPMIKSAPIYVCGQFLFISIAYLCLTCCFLFDDFSVVYVLTNSSIQLPWFYKLCAVWGGHEGSMLLWVTILSLWMLTVCYLSSSLDENMRVRVLVVLGWLSVGFILFLLATSNPYIRQFQILDTPGRDLNPLLQDPGFLFHPPMLYMGYVGFSVAFAFAIAVLWAGHLDSSWTKWTRPWTLAAWCFLTTGITLGSWWAYRELGWGGWWFWDPVENASFMPWLVGTALIHSLSVSEHRNQFNAWTLLLAISAFSLSLIGTFLVRSGVLTSVHAFAVDPQRGVYILTFLLLVIGGSLFLFAIRAPRLQRQQQTIFLSRESILLLNNVLLVVIMLTVLMGTVYPLLIDGLGLGKLSVGAPYFNAVFIPLAIPLFILMGLGIHLNWLRDHYKKILNRLSLLAIISVVSPFLLLLYMGGLFNGAMHIGLSVAIWILLTTIKAFWLRCKLQGMVNVSMAFLGMVIAHMGVAVCIIGITVSSGLGMQDDVKMHPGSTISFAGHQITFHDEQPVTGPNYRGTRAHFLINKYHDRKDIYPEKRIYTIGQMAMTESAIDVTLFRDLYIALGEPLDRQTWSVRLYYKPLVRWIWGGGGLILLGGLFALADKRYYVKKKVTIFEINEAKL